MASRALPDLVARIRVDSTGVDAAAQSLIGSFGKANLALAGLAAGLGILVLGSKSMLDSWREQEKATNDLSQAVAAYNSNLGKTTPAHNVYIAGSVHAKVSAAALKDAHEAVTIATNAVAIAQMKYNEALFKYGSSANQTTAAALRLQDAHIHLSQAQEKLNEDTGVTAARFTKVAATVAKTAIDLDAYKKSIDAFIKANESYISSQAEVVDGFAKLTRSGLDAKESQRVMNDAVDLAALKNISLTDAVNVLEAAEHGRLRGLIDLGITTTKFTDANGNLITSQHSVKDSMNEVDKAVHNGRNTLDEASQASNRLKNHWDDLSRNGGPVIETLLDTVVTGLNNAYLALDKLGHDDNLWAAISQHLTDAAAEARTFFDALTGYRSTAGGTKAPPQSLGGKAGKSGTQGPDGSFIFNEPTGTTGHDSGGYYVIIDGKKYYVPTGGASGVDPNNAGRASGGPVVPGGVYTVGEHGPETLVMGARGGMVIPHGGGGAGMTVNVFGYVGDNRQLALVIRDTLRRLDREQR